VIVQPLFEAWVEFREAFREDCLTKGLEENRKMIEAKIEETKNLIASNEKHASPQVNPI